MPNGSRNRLKISVEVAGLLGPHGVTCVRQQPEHAIYACFTCQDRSRFSDLWRPTSVLVVRYRGQNAVVFAHADCSPSLVLDRDGDPPDALIESTSLFAQRTTAPASALLLGYAINAMLPAANGELVEPLTSRLLSCGFQLLCDLHQPATEVPGLWATVTPGILTLTCRAGVLYRGPMTPSPAWATAMRAEGAITVVVAIGTQLTDKSTVLTSLHHVIAAGHACAGIARVARPLAPGPQER